jgi:hypothetical protein
MVLGGRRQVSGAWALLDRLIVLAAGGRYGSTVVAWSHGSTVQCSFCRKPSSVHPYALRRIASGAGGARVRRRNDLLVFHTPESLPMSSLVPCRATDRSAAGESIIANINKDIPYPRTRPDHQSRGKRTRPAHQAGHVFARLEPASAVCTTRHARTQWNGGLSATRVYGNGSL